MDPNNINPHEVELREQDRWLPIANVARLMKNTLPTTAKVSKDAKECMQECVSEFISFITSEASDKCLREKRKTINGEDILFLMHDLGFENYAEVLKIYLAKYREQQAMKQERGETRASKRQPKNNSISRGSVNGGTDDVAEAAAAAAAVLMQNSPTHSLSATSDSPSLDTVLPVVPGTTVQHMQSNPHSHSLPQLDHKFLQGDGEFDEDDLSEADNNIHNNNATHNNKHIGHIPEDLGIIDQNTENGASHSPIDEFRYEESNGGLHKNNGDEHIDDKEKTKEDGYPYEDFINATGADSMHHTQGDHVHPHHGNAIDDLTNHLTGEQPDIDTLTADITNTGTNGGFF